jgi:hypothetical protein
MASTPYLRVRFGLPAALAAAAGVTPAAMAARHPSHDIHCIPAVAPNCGASGISGTIVKIGP